jgi:hypothetical protein
MFTYPLEIIKKHAQATIPELREIDMYLEQDSESDKKTGLFTAPALFIDFSIVGSMRQHGPQIQSAIVDITFHLLTECLVEKGTTRMKKVTPKDHMTIFDKIYKNFNGFGSKLSFLTEFSALADTDSDMTIMNSLTRREQSILKRFRKAMMKSTQTFRCVVYDQSALIEYTSPTPNLDLSFILDDIEGARTFDDSFDETHW